MPNSKLIDTLVWSAHNESALIEPGSLRRAEHMTRLRRMMFG
jgi:hypothetical protein